MPLLSLCDALYCQEDNFELEQQEQTMHTMPTPLPTEEEWAETLSSLAASEDNSHHIAASIVGDNTYLQSARREAVQWVAATAARHAFSALTAVLAVNYLDRCFLPSVAGAGGHGLSLQDDKPWMARLAAVASLSLAAKVEETRVPPLLDLQGESGGWVFDAKTIRRMELLLLSALGWRMNPVTPLSFVHHLLLRLLSDDGGGAGGGAAAVLTVGEQCEAALLSVIADWRWTRYPASVWAAAALLYVAENEGDFQRHEAQQFIAFLNVPTDKVEECYQLILESMSGSGHKGKHCSSSSLFGCYCCFSPVAVIGYCFSCESSSSSGGDGWTMKPNCIANKHFSGDGINHA